MEIRRYTYVDVYYTEADQVKADKERAKLEKRGYHLEVRDEHTKEIPYCDQYIKYYKFINK